MYFENVIDMKCKSKYEILFDGIQMKSTVTLKFLKFLAKRYKFFVNQTFTFDNEMKWFTDNIPQFFDKVIHSVIQFQEILPMYYTQFHSSEFIRFYQLLDQMLFCALQLMMTCLLNVSIQAFTYILTEPAKFQQMSIIDVNLNTDPNPKTFEKAAYYVATVGTFLGLSDIWITCMPVLLRGIPLWSVNAALEAKFEMLTNLVNTHQEQMKSVSLRKQKSQRIALAIALGKQIIQHKYGEFLFPGFSIIDLFQTLNNQTKASVNLNVSNPFVPSARKRPRYH